MSQVEIYSGRRCLGHVVERDGGKRCAAYDASGEAIGVFPSHLKAVRAVYEVAVTAERGVAA